MQISEAGMAAPEPGTEPCRFPKLEECAHFHYERVQLPRLRVTIQDNLDKSLHPLHSSNEEENEEYYMVQVTSAEECWLVQRNFGNFRMLDAQIHQCIFDRKISQLFDLSNGNDERQDSLELLKSYLERFSIIADNSVNCGPVLNWFQMDNKGHRLLVPSEESRSINTPAVAAAYSVRRYVSQARDELNLEVGDMISVIDMTSPAESIWWRGKRGFQVGFFPQHCVHIIGDKVPRNMPVPPPVVGTLALSPVKPVLRKHGKLIAFFRSFILNRPSRRRLKQSGILKERVFGCDLGEHLLNSGRDVPMVLKCCSEFIEKHGIVDGIYRLSGVTSNIQKLRNTFDEDRIPDLYTEDILQDIHSVASLLKMYFRELPNPLCTYQLYQGFVNAVQGCYSVNRNSVNDRERLLKMREVVQKLPPPHYRTLEYLMRHLARVAKHGTSTGMTIRNIAIVWAPNLLRCAELEVGGVAALQGVGVQAVVTEFLICYTDLIFCDHLPTLMQCNLDVESSMSPKRLRPKSLAISTPTKLITLEEARSKRHLHGKTADETSGYIEVGGGPRNLPKKYHTVIELPTTCGARKRGFSKRSPLGWRSFFTRTRNNSENGKTTRNRKASTPGNIMTEKAVTESDLTEMKRKLRPVKSAESLTSGHSEPVSAEDVLAPLHILNKPQGHNRSVSHDSYFDTLQQNSQNNSEGSLLDLSEIQINFELEESEMRIFSEDESLVSSPRNQRDPAYRRYLTRPRADDPLTSSPKKQARFVLTPDSISSRKRSRLEDQLSDIQFIDCATPENNYVFSTTALIHPQPNEDDDTLLYDLYKTSAPLSSTIIDQYKRHSVESNVENDDGRTTTRTSSSLSKSLTDDHVNFLSSHNNNDVSSPLYENMDRKSTTTSPVYENVLTTISITYKSPVKKATKRSDYHEGDEDNDDDDDNCTTLLNPEQAVVPTSLASLPLQQAAVPVSLQAPKSFDSNDNKSECAEVSSAEEKSDEHSTSSIKVSATVSTLSEIVADVTEILNLNSPNGSSSLNLTTISPTVSPLDGDYNEEYDGSNNRSSPFEQEFKRILSTPFDAEETKRRSALFEEKMKRRSASTEEETIRKSIPLEERFLKRRSAPVEEDLRQRSASLEEEEMKRKSSLVEEQLKKKSTPFDEEITRRITPLILLSSQESLIIDDAKEEDEEEEEVVNEYFQLSEGTASPLTPLEAGGVEGVGNYLSLKEEMQNLEKGFVTLDRPKSVNLIQFSPNDSPDNDIVDDNFVSDKKSECEKLLNENDIYQQVKYFRRSVHEVNTLLQKENAEKFSLESQVVEKEDEESEGNKSKNKEVVTNENEEVEKNGRESYEKLLKDDSETRNCGGALANNVQKMSGVSVKCLTGKFEVVDRKPPLFSSSSRSPKPVEKMEKNQNRHKIHQQQPLDSVFFGSTRSLLTEDRRIVRHERVGALPPCLRAKNVRNATKTRSLDEEEFNKEFLTLRRKSLDENLTAVENKMTSKKSSDHAKSSMECSRGAGATTTTTTSFVDQKLNRERIEKYKEERRKILHEKYRSESFKENDKQVVLSRLKTEQKDTKAVKEEEDKKNEEETNNIKSKTALFESHISRKSNEAIITQKNRKSGEMKSNEKEAKNIQNNTCRGRSSLSESEVKISKLEDDFVRQKTKDATNKNDLKLRRNTYETTNRERENDGDRARRITLENNDIRKDKSKPPPTYCIKDMKAIFERKSQK